MDLSFPAPRNHIIQVENFMECICIYSPSFHRNIIKLKPKTFSYVFANYGFKKLRWLTSSAIKEGFKTFKIGWKGERNRTVYAMGKRRLNDPPPSPQKKAFYKINLCGIFEIFYYICFINISSNRTTQWLYVLCCYHNWPD